MSALFRQSEESKKHQLDDDEALLIALASELCLAVSQRLKFANDLDVCTLAEYELLAQSGKSILAALLAMLLAVLLAVLLLAILLALLLHSY